MANCCGTGSDDRARGPTLAHGRAAVTARILLVSGEYPPDEGGVADYTRCLAEALAARGLAVAVLCARRGAQKPEALDGRIENSVTVFRQADPRWGWNSLAAARRLARSWRADWLHLQYQAAAFGLGLPIHLLPWRLSRALPALRLAVTYHDLREPYLFPKAGRLRPAAVLALAMPQFANLIPQGVHQMEIRIRPTAAPYLTGNAGPNGEPAELYIANLQLDFVSTHLVHDGVVTEAPDGGVKWLTVAIDAPFGFDLTWDDVAGALQPTITLPPTAAVRARVVFNNIQVNAVSTESLVQALFPSMASGLTDTFAAFPLPGFLGLSLDVAEIAESNNTYLLYANLTPAPSTHMENFTLTDVGSANSADDDSGSDSNEWRHRIRKSWGSTAANVTFQSSISADSIVLADEEKGATGAYRMNFTIVPETAGGPWRLELDHNILGAYTCRSEGLGGGTCRMGFYPTSMGTNSPINGSVKVNGGAAQAFNFNPSPQGAGEAGGNFNTQFSGSGSRVITGTGTATIEVNYSFGQRAGSYCGGFICGGDGHEASIRMGLGDTLSNNFTAGEYPGQGNRTQGNDGHRSNLKLCTNTGVACP